MQSEWAGSAESLGAATLVNICGFIGRSLFLVVRIIQSGPFQFCFVPPHQLLPFTPRLAIWTRRGAVVNDPAIVGPGESPSMSQQVFRVSFVGAISIFFRKDAAVDPRATRGRSIVFQIFDMRQLLVVGQRPSVNLAQYILGARLGKRTFGRIVPGERPQTFVSRAFVMVDARFQPPAQVKHEPRLAARVARRIEGLLTMLQ